MKKTLPMGSCRAKTSQHFRCSGFLLDEYCLYVEDYFHEMIYIERKRTERSGAPFVLMLIGVQKLHTEGDFTGIVKKISGSASESTREIDVRGWYRRNHVIGVILAGAGAGEIAPVYSKLKAGLLRPDSIGDETFSKLEISFHVFPEDEGGDRESLPFDRKLYPDAARKNTILRTSLLIKRAIDLCGGIFGLIVFSPLFLAAALLIKLTSRGPVFFRQKRIGEFGAPFVFLKFRSMRAGSDESIHNEYVKKLIRGQKECGGSGESSRVYKIKDDPRVTPVGRLLRRTSLDELPQFINVLKGEMSLVGPRPPIPYELENYAPWHMRRIQEAKPGITGPWQVKGRSFTTFNEMVRMDIGYIRNWSVGLDLKILIRTPWAVLTSKGAY